MQRARPTHVRYIVLAFTVAVYMITYMDRVVISNAAPVIQKEFGFSLITMGWILASFRWAYAFFQIPGGWMGDRIGPRRALTIIVVWWSAFTSFTALSWNAASMAVVRFLFGVGEAGAFPIATRSLSRWMLPGERGFAQGVTHAGSRLGAAMTPPLVVWIITRYNWRAAFFTFGLVGVAWAIAWFFYYRDVPDEHASVNAAEREMLRAGTGGAQRCVGAAVPWGKILSNSGMWYLAAMYFCYNYCLATYLDWFPTYLIQHRHYDLKHMGIYASFPLLAGTVGDLAGGWFSDVLLRATGNVRMSRRAVAVGGFVLAGVGMLPAALTGDPQTSLIWNCIAFFGLEVTVGVAWAIPLDIGGDCAGSVSAVMNTCGNIGGAISPAALAYLVKAYGWNMPFLVTASLCAIGAVIYAKIDASRKIELA